MPKSEVPTLLIVYKKFNTFYLDYIRTIRNNWLFMRMKHRYPVGTTLQFKFKVTALPQELLFNGVVMHHGVNDQGLDGIGIKLNRNPDSAKLLDEQLAMMVKDRFGEYWGGQIAGFLRDEL